MTAETKNNFLFSYRFLWACFMSVGFALFFGSCFSTLNFAIVCMVNSTYSDDQATVANQTVQTAQCGSANSTNSYNGVFKWSSTEVANILAAYYWFSPLALFGFAWLLPRVGLARIFLICGALASITTLLTPVAAIYGGPVGTIIIRFCAGTTAAVNRALAVGFSANWAPENELGQMLSIVGSAVIFGILLIQPISGVLCKTLGWQYVFYVWGGLSALWLIPSFFLVTSGPESNRFISEKERNFIVNNRRGGKSRKNANVPWRILVTSPVVLGTLVAFFANRLSLQFFGVFGPTYMKQALGVDVTSNGLYSAMPYLAQILGRYITGFAVDKLKFMSTTTRLKTFNTIGSVVGAVCFIGLCQIPCGKVGQSVAVLTLQYFITSLVNGGSISAVVFFAPTCSSQVQLIFSFCLFCFAAVTPYIVTAVTKDGTPAEWAIPFYFLAALNIAGAITFLIWGSGEPQKAFEQNQISEKNGSTVEKQTKNPTDFVTIERF